MSPYSSRNDTASTIVTQATRNVIVCGETGAGKSSIINMIIGEEVAKVSDAAKGVTFESTPYPTTLPDDFHITLWDTAGLNEGTKGKVNNREAIIKLHQLICDLREHGGVSLLVFCMRGPRITESSTDNYRMFYSSFCRKKVPIIMLVIPGESLGDDWGNENKAVFRAQKMIFAGQACVVATKKLKGDHDFEKEYYESAATAQGLIRKHCAPEPWQMDSTSDWFVAVLTPIVLSLGWVDLSWMVRIPLLDSLKNFGRMNHQDAVKLVREVEAGLEKRRQAARAA